MPSGVLLACDVQDSCPLSLLIDVRARRCISASQDVSMLVCICPLWRSKRPRPPAAQYSQRILIITAPGGRMRRRGGIFSWFLSARWGQHGDCRQKGCYRKPAGPPGSKTDLLERRAYAHTFNFHYICRHLNSCYSTPTGVQKINRKIILILNSHFTWLSINQGKGKFRLGILSHITKSN